MKRVLGPVLVVVALALTLPAAATGSGNYKDKFISIGWGGSDGSLAWSGPWVEIGDDSDEKFGSVRVVSSGYCPSGNCMYFDASLLMGPIGASRDADTSVLQEPALSFDLVNLPDGLDLGAAVLRVQVFDGSGWTTLAEYDLGETIEVHPTFDLSDFRSENFVVRFEVQGPAMTSQVFIDNVEISEVLIEQTTTTTPTTEGDGKQTTTTTTEPRPSTTTTRPTTTTTRGPDDDSSTSATVDETTTTTSPDDSTASTFVVAAGDDDLPPGSDGPPEGSGIRQSARGLQANFEAGLFGDVSAISPITGVDFQARFSMAVESIEARWAWIVLLALVIAWSIVSGMERRRTQILG
ncbi:MAG: hypothetical protein WD895_02735 [Acidimicrobiia bacterium]